MKKAYKGIFRYNDRVLGGVTSAHSEAQAFTFFITRLMKKLNMTRVELLTYYETEPYTIKELPAKNS